MTNSTVCFASVPTGALIPFAGVTAPDDYLLCDGSAVDRTTYQPLFDVIGTQYGAGDGSTTFNLPDLRGRVAVGRDNMGGSTAGRLTIADGGINGVELGAAGGKQTHTLTIEEMPAHTHGVYWMTAGNNYAGGNGAIPKMTTTQSTGGGLPHPIVQPSIIVNHLIKI